MGISEGDRTSDLVFSGRVDFHPFHVRRTGEQVGDADRGVVVVFDRLDPDRQIGEEHISVPPALGRPPDEKAWEDDETRSAYLRAVAGVKLKGIRIIDRHYDREAMK
jgi:hypothetical protein